MHRNLLMLASWWAFYPTRYGKHILDCQREVSYRKSCQQLPKVWLGQEGDLAARDYKIRVERWQFFVPPWANIALDFAGPYVVKGEVNRRARMKILILIYCCLATGTGCLLAFPGFSTSDFLCQHAEFVYRKEQVSSKAGNSNKYFSNKSLSSSRKDL